MCHEQSAIENARVGYQVATNLWTYEGAATWDRFNVMLVANSIFLYIIGSVAMDAQKLPSIAITLPIVGLALCAAWFVLTARGFSYQRYYVACARELEEGFLASIVTTVSRGDKYGEGKTVIIKVKDGNPEFQMGPSSSILKAGTTARIVIVLFAVIYVLALVYFLFVKRVICS